MFHFCPEIHWCQCRCRQKEAEQIRTEYDGVRGLFHDHAGEDGFLKMVTSEEYSWENKCDNIKLYDQFPCGLFYEDKNEQNRLFNRGAFDLWGVDNEGNICLFELKEEKNHSLGIISELFFYSCLIKDFKSFLAPKLYSFIKDNLNAVLEKMNERNDGVIYDYIKFDQKKIVKPEKTDVEIFIKNLKEEWEKKNEKGH